MPKFITIGYGNEAGYKQTKPEVRDAAHAHDEELKRRGAIMGITSSPVQVRNHNNEGVAVERGSFLQADLPIAGFGMIEASSLEEAIQLASQSPCAVAQGVIEVWPFEEG